VGSDPNTTTRDFALTLHVVDFNLTAPAPVSLSMNQSSVSGPVAFQVTAAGAFNQVVTLSCGGLPAGTTCNFAPSSSASPISTSPATVTMTITAGATTPLGTSQIAITGSGAGGPVRTQNLALTIVAASVGSPDFALAVSNPSLTVNPNESAVFNGTLTSSGGYASPVNLRCLGAVPLTCTASPATLIPTTAGAAFTVTASNDAENHFNFSIDASGTDAAQIHKSTPVELIVGFNFVINNDSTGQTIPAGQIASYNLVAVPLGNGSVFPGNLALSCSGAGMPPLSTCSFTPGLVASGEGTTNLVLKVATTSAATADLRFRGGHLLWYDLSFSLAGVIAFGNLKKSRRRKKSFLRIGMLFVLLGLLAGCGNGSSGGSGGTGGSGAGHPGTTPGNYTITVTGVVGSVTRTADVALTVQ
jgi:hypothetical protein